MNSFEATPQSIRVLKRAYNQAVKKGQSEFIFNGSHILTAYAKHLIEFWESQLKK